MDKDEVLKLSKLSRIRISDEEAESLVREFDSILSYVGEIKKISGKEAQGGDKGLVQKNVLREDDNPHEGGIYTEAVLKQAPEREGQYIKVKKIL